MKVVWEYLVAKNGFNNGPVAVLKKEDGSRILYVHEGSSHHYTIISGQFYFINTTQIPYLLESQLVERQYKKELDSLSAREVLTKRLEAGCRLIEEDFQSQVSEILRKLS